MLRALSGDSLVAEVEVNKQVYEVHYSPLLSDTGTQLGAIGVAIDISERKQHEQALVQLAHFDPLTGLPNRALITSQMQHAFKQARRYHKHVALLYIDLDNFKVVNDTKGHEFGDRLLKLAAERLRGLLRETDIPARLGGDEFLVVSSDLPHVEAAEVLAHKIANAFRRPFSVDDGAIYASTSIGIAVYPDDGDSASQLMQCADTAMYHAKALGKNNYHFFTSTLQQRAERHLLLETELRQALNRGELSLMYQPKVDLRTRRVEGAEALLRWHSPKLELVSPDEFIPVAELAGLMPQIGAWVLREACRAAARWLPLSREHVSVAVNVSPQQLHDVDLTASIAQALNEAGLPADRLELEITENMLVQDANHMIEMFAGLRDLGVRLSLDDFGTGYSSLSYLQRMPLQVLKIDKTFVQRLGSGKEASTLVDAIVAMAHGLRLKIVAEGVETQDQLDYLERRGVDLVQGYYFSRPVDAATFEHLLVQTTWPSQPAESGHQSASR